MLYLGDSLAKVGSSGKCCVLVFKSSMLYLWGCHQPKKVCLPSIVYWYSRQLFSLVFKTTSLTSRQGSSSQRRLVCQIWAHLQFYALLHRRSFRITYERPNKYGYGCIHTCEIFCSCIVTNPGSTDSTGLAFTGVLWLTSEGWQATALANLTNQMYMSQPHHHLAASRHTLMQLIWRFPFCLSILC